MKIALVHDYLNQRGGAERVFAHHRHRVAATRRSTRRSTTNAPSAISCRAERVRTSYLARVPFANKGFRAARAVLSAARSRRSTSRSSIRSSVRRRLGRRACIVPPGAVHVCYINTVSRFAFAYDDYVGGVQAAPPLLAVRSSRAWSPGIARAAQRPTRFVANSRNVAERIAEYYGRDADVLHCPVDVDRFTVGTGERRLLRDRVAAAAVQAHRPRDPRRRAGRRAAATSRAPARPRSRIARARARNDDDDARIRRRRAAERTDGAARAPRFCRAKKISASCRSRRRRPDVRRSRCAAAARSKRSSKGGPARSSTSRRRVAGASAAHLRSLGVRSGAPARARADVFARNGSSKRCARSSSAFARGGGMRSCAAWVGAAVVSRSVYIAYDLNKLYALRYGADLGTYLQTLVNLAARIDL